MRKKSKFMQVLERGARYLLVVMLGYLMHVCVMPYFRVGGVTPHLMIVVLSVITVAHGRLRAYWTGCIYGLITETMRPTLPFFNLFMYPVLSLVAGLLFADKSEKRLEAERSMNKAARNVHPYIRTPLCSAVLMLLHEIVNVGYIYIGGTDLTADHISRAVTGVIVAVALALLVMIPARRLLGMSKPKRSPDMP